MNSHFQIKYQFSIFYQFYISKMFLPIISQKSKMCKHENGNKCNSKTKGQMTMKIGTDVKYTLGWSEKTKVFDLFFG